MRLGPLRGAAIGATLTLLTAATDARQSPQPPQPPTFRAEANLVRVDVTVVDRHGEPVTAKQCQRAAYFESVRQTLG